ACFLYSFTPSLLRNLPSIKSNKSNYTNHSKPLLINGVVCTLMRNEAQYVREWVSFHLILGANFFVIYDDNSTDGLNQIVQGFGERVKVIPWGQNNTDQREHVQGRRQVTAARHCVSNYGTLTSWIAFIDVDEFVWPCQRDSNLLDYHIKRVNTPSIRLDCFKFGTGYPDRTQLPSELTVEKHILRAPYRMMNENYANITKNLHECRANNNNCASEGGWKYIYFTNYGKQKFYQTIKNTISVHGSGAPFKRGTTDRRQGICCNHYGVRSTEFLFKKAIKNRNPALTTSAKSNHSKLFYNSIHDILIWQYLPTLKNFLNIYRF
ncbi:unnamed protein product, partial [Didymodactylos carnosus]